ncbi:unnamed protein product, partial [Symbiodinium microadriaticum]
KLSLSNAPRVVSAAMRMWQPPRTSWCAFRVPCESSRSQGRRASRQCGNMHKVRWKDGDVASAVEDLQEQDSQLMEELQRVAGESEELRKKSEQAGKSLVLEPLLEGSLSSCRLP